LFLGKEAGGGQTEHKRHCRKLFDIHNVSFVEPVSLSALIAAVEISDFTYIRRGFC
jgi:hypothetical protein